jgi:hypothetical protein
MAYHQRSGQALALQASCAIDMNPSLTPADQTAIRSAPGDALNGLPFVQIHLRHRSAEQKRLRESWLVRRSQCDPVKQSSADVFCLHAQLGDRDTLPELPDTQSP